MIGFSDSVLRVGAEHEQFVARLRCITTDATLVEAALAEVQRIVVTGPTIEWAREQVLRRTLEAETERLVYAAQKAKVIEDVREQLADITQTCRIAYLADLRDGQSIWFAFDHDEIVVLAGDIPCELEGSLVGVLSIRRSLADISTAPYQGMDAVEFVAAIAVEILVAGRPDRPADRKQWAAEFVRGRSRS